MSYLIGNCIEVMKTLDEKYDLIYIDPPYNTGRDWYNFDDRFHSPADYIKELIQPMILECHKAMKDNSTIVIHVEPKCSHWVKVCAEEIFGEIVNEIVWVTGGNKNSKKKLQRNHDTLLVYTKGVPTFNQKYTPYKVETIAKSPICQIRKERYTTSALVNRQPNIVQRPNLRYEWNGNTLQWWVSRDRMEMLHIDNRLVYNAIGIPRVKKYFNELKGIPIKDTWDDISIIQGNEKMDYATQKPVALLKRIVEIYTNENDIVLDPCAGSGTTGRACVSLNRRYTLIDMNLKAKEMFENSLTNCNRGNPIKGH